MTNRVTAQDVALLAGVSQSTVVFALHDIPGVRISMETRRRVLDAARELRYAFLPATGIQKKVPHKRRVLALIERRSADCRFDASFGQMLLGVHRAAAFYGFTVLSFAVPPADNRRDFRAMLRRHKPGGIILSSPHTCDLDLIDWLAAKVPVVARGFLPDCEHPSVRVNDYEVGRLATDHLIRLGHVRLGALLHAPLAYPEASERLRGYQDSLLEMDMEMDQDTVACANFTPESAEEPLNALMSAEPQPTAIFASSDTVALGAMKVARNKGIHIPGDLAIVGFGDIPSAVHGDPPLTTLRVPGYASGWMAADMLIREMTGREISEPSIVLPAELIVRRSCGAFSEDLVLSHVEATLLH